MGFLAQGTQEPVRKSRGKRAISVRAIEVLLYTKFSAIDARFYVLNFFSILIKKNLKK